MPYKRLLIGIQSISFAFALELNEIPTAVKLEADATEPPDKHTNR